MSVTAVKTDRVASSTGKYRSSFNVVQTAIANLINEIAPGKKIVDLCKLGDQIITDQLSTVYKNIKNKGIAFPTSISVNNMTGNFSPLEEDNTVLNAGDLVKIELGAHIDGYAAVGAETYHIEKDDDDENEERSQLLAALKAVEEELDGLLVAGTTNTTISDTVNEVAARFNCSTVKGADFHLVERLNFFGKQKIVIKPDPDDKIEEAPIEENQVYSINILLSTGDGKPKLGEARTTIFKKSLDTSFNLRLKASRAVFNEINHKFQYFPFTLRSFQDVIKARLAINELAKSNVVDSFPVLFEKPNKLVAQKRYTVLVRPGKTLKLATETFSSGRMDVDGGTKGTKDIEMGDSLQATPSTSKSKSKSRKRNIEPEESTEMEDVTHANTSHKKNKRKKH